MDSSNAAQFRAKVLDISSELQQQFEAYFKELTERLNASESALNKCSTFAENCQRFADWLTRVESDWSIPLIDTDLSEESMTPVVSSHKVDLQ